ncbi:hypothetical protein JCM12107_07010 [Corynebacterium simulans]
MLLAERVESIDWGTRTTVPWAAPVSIPRHVACFKAVYHDLVIVGYAVEVFSCDE